MSEKNKKSKKSIELEETPLNPYIPYLEETAEEYTPLVTNKTLSTSKDEIEP
ncbi:hypothetical protein [Metabacillus arenae]|uniref:Uncharacterized protein n=1 Tax=Metabacillus arenae TaxID=2771434 RepID=A0A926RXZ7_9BACI|nr:hypothetical protein [Metabacillus arenae]MBD1380672.1 hypothetical protein [Metabacillus arenae]